MARKKFELHCHELTVRFVEKAAVPPYERSMIRGAFGRAFKQSCCPFPHGNGSGCPFGDKCPYGYDFETSPPEGAGDFARNQEVPRPYVFEPPEDTKMEYAPGERMRFGLHGYSSGCIRDADLLPSWGTAESLIGVIPTVNVYACSCLYVILRTLYIILRTSVCIFFLGKLLATLFDGLAHPHPFTPSPEATGLLLTNVKGKPVMRYDALDLSLVLFEA